LHDAQPTRLRRALERAPARPIGELLSGKNTRGARGRPPFARLPSPLEEGTELMNLYTIGAICGIVALILVIIFVL
jgi:hypothetical protein